MRRLFQRRGGRRTIDSPDAPRSDVRSPCRIGRCRRQCAELRQQRFHEKQRGLDCGQVGGQRLLQFDGSDALLDGVGATDVVLVEEVDQGVASGALSFWQ